MSEPLSVAGVTPREMVTPRDRDELAQIVRALHAGRNTFAFVGGGTELALGNPPRSLDTVVRTTKLDRVVDYTPEDQTVTVEAGMTVAALDALLAAHGQMLPLDVGDRERATIGGAIATNASGRRRQRYGTARDLIVGVEIVRPDGVRARGGGKVVKNVAGFDLPKLMVGSLGTLGAIATVTLRVYPRSETSRTVTANVRHGDAQSAAAALIACRLEPESVTVIDGRMFVTFGGLRSGVDQQTARALQTLEDAGLGDPHDAGREACESADRTERSVRYEDPWRFHVLFPPAPPAGAPLPYRPYAHAAATVAYPLAGVAFGSADGGAEAPSIERIRERVRAETAASGRVVVDAMPDPSRGTVDAWGPPPASLALMRAIKRNFDPHALCNPGRFVGGI